MRIPIAGRIVSILFGFLSGLAFFAANALAAEPDGTGLHVSYFWLTTVSVGALGTVFSAWGSWMTVSMVKLLTRTSMIEQEMNDLKELCPECQKRRAAK